MTGRNPCSTSLYAGRTPPPPPTTSSRTSAVADGVRAAAGDRHNVTLIGKEISVTSMHAYTHTHTHIIIGKRTFSHPNFHTRLNVLNADLNGLTQ
jgi:hypothetical protein